MGKKENVKKFYRSREEFPTLSSPFVGIVGGTMAWVSG